MTRSKATVTRLVASSSSAASQRPQVTTTTHLTDSLDATPAAATTSHSPAWTRKKTIRDIPGPSPSWPLLGTSWEYNKFFGRYDVKKLHAAHLDRHRRYGPIAREEYQGGRYLVHLFKAADIQRMFRAQGKYPIRPPNEFVCHYRRSHPDPERYPTVGLAHLLGEEWYRERVTLTPALMQLDVIRNHVASQSEVAEDFVEYIRQTSTTKESDDCSLVIDDLQDATYRLALESICRMCLDVRIGAFDTRDPQSDGQRLIAATKSLFDAYNELYYGFPLWKYIRTASYRKLDAAETQIYDITYKYIEEATREFRKTQIGGDGGGHRSPEGIPSVLRTLLSNADLTEKHIQLVVLDFIAGGIFTVSNSLNFLLYHFARNPQVQEAAYQELCSVGFPGTTSTGGRGDPVDPSQVDSLKYLKACTKESFRLTPTVPAIVRLLPEAIELSGYEIPPMTPLFAHLMVIARQKEYFSRPTEFLPDRWLGASNRRSIAPFTFLPFGFGNRMCAGRRFAELELHLSTAHILANYRVELTHNHHCRRAREDHRKDKKGTDQEENQERDLDLDLRHAFIVIPAQRLSLKFVPRRR